MKNKIYENREGLQGKKFIVNLKGNSYQFKIMYVNRKEIVVYTSIKFKDIDYAKPNSVEGIVKNTIIENTPDNYLSLSRRASLASNKLKKVPVIVDDNKFRFDFFTNSGVRLVKSIDYDELFESKKGCFVGDVFEFVRNDLSDNPPKPKKFTDYGYSGDMPYLFDSGGFGMHFQTLGHRRTVVSEVQLEKNREKNKKFYEEQKEKREKMKKLEKELNLDKKSKTRDLARFR